MCESRSPQGLTRPGGVALDAVYAMDLTEVDRRGKPAARHTLSQWNVGPKAAELIMYEYMIRPGHIEATVRRID